MRLSQLCHHDRVRGAMFHTQPGYTQKTQPRDLFPLQGGKQPTQAMGLLARFRHDHLGRPSAQCPASSRVRSSTASLLSSDGVGAAW